MFIVVVRHYVKPDKVDKAIARIDNNGELMAEVPGFLFRHRMVAKNDPLIMSTITAWMDEASFQVWQKIKAGLPATGESPYVRFESESHLVERSHTDAMVL
jgi:heme-degrading monooxygenase HmoA